MANKNRELGRFHEVIETKYVFIEDQQVFMRKRVNGNPSENHGDVWYPIDLEWIPMKNKV